MILQVDFGFYLLVLLLIVPSFPLEGTCLQSKTCGLVNAEHEIHVLDGLADGTLQQVVDTGSDEQFVAVFLDMYQCLVGVYHLLQVDGLVAVMCKSSIGIEVLVGLNDVGLRGLGADDGGAENASGEVATVGDEVDVGIKITLYLSDALLDLSHMLVGEGLVDAQVVVAP